MLNMEINQLATIIITRPLAKPSVQIMGKSLYYLGQIIPAEPDPDMLIAKLKRT